MCDWSVSRDEKIYLYLRVPSIAEHDLLWCGAAPLTSPAAYVWLKFTADQPLASQVLASQTHTRSPSFLLVLVCSCLPHASVGEVSVFRKGESDLVWI